MRKTFTRTRAGLCRQHARLASLIASNYSLDVLKKISGVKRAKKLGLDSIKASALKLKNILIAKKQARIVNMVTGRFTGRGLNISKIHLQVRYSLKTKT
jgi:hypothetical protein